ncbi:hypothetical protein NC652_009980 [Populus alba x Populus x berolinensis]|uniref:Uncharacterized protein n=1 Tax=Populus alba x Populus x berolinensis TaxID=444605 RepID=A0AAD6WA04_9ROSI|nr:hypothetical protein NC652_009980 [Populus alba x Populus x berolinensis]KAJ7004762.1 hypothetical protein NC653_009563 [Populus alba x Populus x berolinensis]
MTAGATSPTCPEGKQLSASKQFKWPFHMEDVRCDNEEAIYAAKETSQQTTLLSSFKQSRAGK